MDKRPLALPEIPSTTMPETASSSLTIPSAETETQEVIPQISTPEPECCRCANEKGRMCTSFAGLLLSAFK